MKDTRLAVCLMVVVVAIMTGQGFATLILDDGRTYNLWWRINDDIRIDFDTPSMGTTLNLLAGGTIYSSQIFQDGRMNVTGGVLSGGISASQNSQITINNGTIGTSLNVSDNSLVTINDGVVGSQLLTYGNCQVTMHGGSVGSYLYAFDNSQVTMRGGTIAQDILLVDEAILNIHGSDFTVDGNPVVYGNITSLIGHDIEYEPDRRLYGTLASGEIINNDFRIGNTAKIVLIYDPVGEPEPICTAYPNMDFNKDCKVDLQDFAIFSQSWLDCNLEPQSACWE